MCIKKTMALLAAAAALQVLTASAQVVSIAGNTNLLRIKFRATCVALGNNGQLFASNLNESDIVTQCVGPTLARNFALAYNATADAIQVVSTADGTDMCDVILFQGGDFTSSSRASRRFTFMFAPNQTDAIGSAIIAEQAPTSVGLVRNSGRTITGNVQFELGGTNVLGGGGTVAAAAVVSSTTGTISTPNTNITFNTTSTNILVGTTDTTGTTGTTGTTAADPTFFFTTSALGGTSPNTNVRVCQGTFTTVTGTAGVIIGPNGNVVVTSPSGTAVAGTGPNGNTVVTSPSGTSVAGTGPNGNVGVISTTGTGASATSTSP